MLTLTKENDGYIDNDGLSWDTPAEWLWVGILGGCGCGSAEEFGERAVRLLKHFATDIMDQTDNFEGEFYELMMHWFDDKGLIEHGAIITDSWLTDKGKDVYALVRM